MILTVTPNPSIDLLYEAEQICWDDANRVETPRKRAGGQGINLTRAARVLGGESEAIAFFGGRTGDELRALLDDDPTPVHEVPIAGETRLFVAARETSTGRSMLLNSHGPILTQTDRAHFLEAIDAVSAASNPDWLVCSGSIPRGAGTNLYAEAAAIARRHGVRFMADCDGDALSQSVRAGCDLIAPNKHETERLLHKTIGSIGDAARAARDLLSQSPIVLLKLSWEGALLAMNERCWHARPPVMKQGSSVGAGDAFLAGFLVAQKNEAPPEEALRRATAAGSAVLLSNGTALLTRADYDAVLADVVVTEV